MVDAWFDNQIFVSGTHYLQSLELLTQATIIAKVKGEFSDQARFLSMHGVIIAIYLGQLDKGFQFIEQALHIAREHEDQVSEALCLSYLGIIHMEKEEYEKAEAEFNNAIVIHKLGGRKDNEVIELGNLAGAYVGQGKYELAIELIGQNLAFYEENTNEKAEANDLCNLSVAYREMGNYKQSLEYVEQSLTIRRKIYDRFGEALSIYNMGLLFKEQGNTALARETLQNALSIYESLDLINKAEEINKIISEMEENQP